MHAISEQSNQRSLDIQDIDKSLYPDIDTGLPSVNTLFQYYFQRSQKENIHFSCQLNEPLSYVLNLGFHERELTVVIADLIENAFHAVKSSPTKHILITTTLADEIFVFNIFDSGHAFSTETLLKMGKEEYTTHKTDGGSGIGLMNLYDFIHSHNVSCKIEEMNSKSEIYTKNISLIFHDRMPGNMIFKTSRSDVAMELSAKRHDWIVQVVDSISFDLS